MSETEQSPSASGSSGNTEGTRMVTIPVNLPLPEKLVIQKGNLAESWRKFKRAWSNYELAAKLKDPLNPEFNKEQRAATLLTCIGSDALDVIDGLDFATEADRNNIDRILEKLEKYCIGQTNESYERYVFNKREQHADESIDTYIAALRKLAQTCNFGTIILEQY